MARERLDTSPLGSAFRPGIVVGEKFTLLRLIAEGGYGAVYEAKDNLLLRHVAVKLLHPDVGAMPEIVARFLREAQALAKIDHPNVVAVHEMGRRRDGSYFMVQELLSGGNLRDHLKEKGRLSPSEAIDVLEPVMSALVSAHQQHIIHRDLKPENVVLARTTSGAVLPKLVDFGIAKLPRFSGMSGSSTVVGHIFGTPAYMAPEQVIGSSKVDARADVWAMGVVFFELLSGECPFQGEDEDVLDSVRSQPIPKLRERRGDVPPELAHIVHKALEKKAERRPSMQAFREEILAFREGQRIRAPRRPASAHIGRAAEAPRPAGSPAEKAADTLDVMKPVVSSTDSVVFFDAPLPLGPAEPIEPMEPEADELPLASTDFIRDSHASASASLASPPSERAPSRPDMGWTHDLPLPESPAARKLVLDAEHALSVNALGDAIDQAERAIQKAHGASEVAGRARLVLAIACSWLGGHADAQRAAADAMQSFRRGTSAWYTAIGHLALADGQLGSRKGLMTIVEALRTLEATGPVTDAHSIAACRLFVSLVRTGLLDVAQKVYDGTLQRAAKQPATEPFARGWLAVAGAERAAHSGDPMTYLHYVTQAVDAFTEAGDVRGASLQRVNTGNAYIQLGCYAQAEAILRDALRAAEPMGLGFLAPLKANLGFALARLGRTDEAAALEAAALKQCDRNDDKRFGSVARIYLAMVLGQQKDVGAAVTRAREAIAASGDFPAIHAYAQATLAGLLVEQGKATEGLRAAASAMSALDTLEGAEEGESLIRLNYAWALYAASQKEKALTVIGDAARRLIARADRIRDPRFRKSFLDYVPENARTMRLLDRWSSPRSP